LLYGMKSGFLPNFIEYAENVIYYKTEGVVNYKLQLCKGGIFSQPLLLQFTSYKCDRVFFILGLLRLTLVGSQSYSNLNLTVPVRYSLPGYSDSCFCNTARVILQLQLTVSFGLLLDSTVLRYCN
jgi:hypothetical protein